LPKRYKSTIILIIIIVVILLYLSISYINSNDDNKSSDTILFLGNENLAPIVYEENGIAKGVAVDLVKAIEEKTGYRIHVEAMDWQEAQSKVLTGEADALLQINPNPERKRLYDFSDPLLESEFSIFTDSGSDIKSVDDLKNRWVGVEAGGYAYNLLHRYEGIKIVTISNCRIGLQKVITGELDAIVSDRWIGTYELAQNKIDRIQVVEEPIETSYSRIAVKKGNEELLQIINTGLQGIKDDNTMNDIIYNWKGKNVIYFTEEKIIRIILYTALGIIIFILLISIFFINRYKKLSKKLELDVRQRTKELHETNELLRKANLELERISTIDKLTGIYNRRYFDNSIEKTWTIALRENHPVSLIMIDIDHFKVFNDTYGHLAGDQCLKSIANEIKDTLQRTGDFVARFGGEEFAVLLLNTSENGATIVAEKIRKRIERLKIIYEGIEARVTVSLGVASMIPDDRTNPKDLICAADEALYKAKEAGRNRVITTSK
jgi:diguanylate cyclase (GGDEF)-like protein